MKVLVQMVEIWIWVSVIILWWRYFFFILNNTDLFDYFFDIFYSLSYFIWTNTAVLLMIFFLISIIVMVWRWIVSFLATDAGNRPNK